MSIPKNLNFTDYSHYPSDENPTTDSEMQVFMSNQNALVKELAYMLWQPQTSYVAGQVIHSSSMPAGAQAIVTVGGISGNSEPNWTAIGTVVVDSGVTYTMINIVTTISITGSGNAVTDVTNNNGRVTLTKGATYLTKHQDISGKANKANITAGTAGTSSATSGSTLAVPYVTVNNQGIVTSYGTHTHTVSGFSASGHTHNYAGSSSAGGAANSAVKATGDQDGANIKASYANRFSGPSWSGDKRNLYLISKSGATLSTATLKVSTCSCSCSCIIQGNVLTNKGYVNIKELKENDYIIDDNGNACKVKGIAKHTLGNRKAVALGECIITDDHLVMKVVTPLAYNVGKYHDNKMIVCEADNGARGYYPNHKMVMCLDATAFKMDSETVVYLPIVENAEWCVVDGNVVACARWDGK